MGNLILGLDLSVKSSGMVEFNADTMKVHSKQNLALDLNRKDPMYFAEASLQMERYLVENFSETHYKAIVLEDIFLLRNVETFRLLGALSVTVDRLVETGVLKCDDYRRVPTKVWKQWLYTGAKPYKGLNDKLRVQRTLNDMGYFFSGSGSEDRYDALGLCVGYLKKDSQTLDKSLTRESSLSLSDLECRYFLFEEELEQELKNLNLPMEVEKVKFFRLTEKSLLGFFDEDDSKIFISSSKVSLGNLVEKLGLEPIVGGGYFAVWRKVKGDMNG